MRSCGRYLLLIVVGVYVDWTLAFQCHVCSYSANTDRSTDCIYAPDLLTSPTNFYRCNRTCTIQENFSLEEQRVTSYMRTCSKVTKSEFCVKDTWSIVCYFSCLGELCNNYAGVLHTIYTVRTHGAGSDTISSGDDFNRSSPGNVDSVLVFAMLLVMFELFEMNW